jgi:hypothetical protein
LHALRSPKSRFSARLMGLVEFRADVSFNHQWPTLGQSDQKSMRAVQYMYNGACL